MNGNSHFPRTRRTRRFRGNSTRQRTLSLSLVLVLRVVVGLHFSMPMVDASHPPHLPPPQRIPSESSSTNNSGTKQKPIQRKYGRTGPTEYILTPQQIEDYRANGCCTLPDVLTEEEVAEIEALFDRFVNREIPVPGKDFCDMSKSFDTPFEEWSIVNCMLPTVYHPPFQDNIYERLTACIVKQLHPQLTMVKDYDQFLNKRPGKSDAIFAWHQDMGYWPSTKVLGVAETTTATFSLAIDDSMIANGCLRYVPGSHHSQTLRPHVPLIQASNNEGDREKGHALTIDVDETVEPIVYAPANRGSVTIHNEYVVHGSGGNTLAHQQRRTYVLAYRPEKVVAAERAIGFTHSHNDEINWDTFDS